MFCVLFILTVIYRVSKKFTFERVNYQQMNIYPPQNKTKNIYDNKNYPSMDVNLKMLSGTLYFLMIGFS